MITKQMKEKWTEIEPDAAEKQEKRFETWLSGKNISFVGPEAEEKYRERVTLIRDAVQLKKHPCGCPSARHRDTFLSNTKESVSMTPCMISGHYRMPGKNIMTISARTYTLAP